MRGVGAEIVGHEGCTLDLCTQLTKNFGTVIMVSLPPHQ